MSVLGKCLQTRLLGRPQPQMYPPVALNQYTLVNRTHKHRPHHSGDICTTRGNNLKTIFSFMGQNVKKMYILGVFWGP